MCVFFCKQKTAYDLRISDWSSDVCSSDLRCGGLLEGHQREAALGERWLGVSLGPAGVDEPEPVLPDPEDVPGPHHLLPADLRSDERRVGKEGVRTCRLGGSPSLSKKNTSMALSESIHCLRLHTPPD